MTFLPIVERELRVASRRRATYWSRFLAVLVAVALIAWMILTFGGNVADPQSAGQTIFVSLSVIAFLFSLFAGAHTTADSISSEKREGTLGLLFLTDLKSYDIVFGKLAATSLNAFYSLLGIFPVMALPLLMGGVPPAEFGRMAAVLFVTLFFSLSAGLCVSSMVRKERNAAGLTLLLILVIAGGVPLSAEIWQELTHSWNNDLRMMMNVPSPGFAFFMVIEYSAKGAWLFWSSLATIFSLGWVFLLVALVATPHSWKDRPLEASPKSWQAKWSAWNFGGAETRRNWRIKLLSINPVLWLASRNRLQFFSIWYGMLLAALVWLGFYLKYKREWLELPMPAIWAFCLNSFLKLRIIPAATRRFAEDRRDGALELMLCTPTSVKEILRGQILALRKQFAAPVAVALLANVLLMIAGFGQLRGEHDQPETIGLFVVAMVFLVVDCVTLGCVGMWQGLVAKNFTKASSNTAAQVLFLPWAFFIGAIFTLQALDSRAFDGFGFWGTLGLWIVCGLVVNAVFCTRAVILLRTRFRSEALRRYQPPKRRWFFSSEPK